MYPPFVGVLLFLLALFLWPVPPLVDRLGVVLIIFNDDTSHAYAYRNWECYNITALVQQIPVGERVQLNPDAVIVVAYEEGRISAFTSDAFDALFAPAGLRVVRRASVGNTLDWGSNYTPPSQRGTTGSTTPAA